MAEIILLVWPVLNTNESIIHTAECYTWSNDKSLPLLCATAHFDLGVDST